MCAEGRRRELGRRTLQREIFDRVLAKFVYWLSIRRLIHVCWRSDLYAMLLKRFRSRMANKIESDEMNDVDTIENRRCKFVNIAREKVLLIKSGPGSKDCSMLTTDIVIRISEMDRSERSVEVIKACLLDSRWVRNTSTISRSLDSCSISTQYSFHWHT